MNPSNYPPAVLSRTRRLVTATASGLPITVGAGAQVSVTIAWASSIEDLTAQSHTRLRCSLFASVLTVASGGEPFIVVQSANLQTGSQQVVQPLNTGSSLGAYNDAALAGELTFDTDDLLALGLAEPSAVQAVIVVSNSDTSSHNVSGATATLLIEATQYAEQYLETV